MSLEYSIEASYIARSTLALLRPYDVVGARKIRVGRPFDGGYVMIDAFAGVEAAYSLGINDDVSWDFDIAQHNIDIYQYDHTIDGLPYAHPRFRWQKIGIAAQSSGEMRSLGDLVEQNGHLGSKNLLLKCDIECSEWDSLYHISGSVLSKFSQIVIEIHDLERVGRPDDLVSRQALKNLTNHHNVVHVHANNYGGHRLVGGIPMPNVIELTLLRKDMGQFVPSQTTFPTPMDMPCNKDWADIYLGGFTFS